MATGIFGGGSQRNGFTNFDLIEFVTIESAGNAADFGDLTVARDGVAACSNGTNNRGLFGGGWISLPTNIIDYVSINSAGNATDFGDFIIARYFPASCSNGTNNRGLFGGGWGFDGYSFDFSHGIDFVSINSAGNAADFGDLTEDRDRLSACSNGTSNRGVFGGSGFISATNIIDYVSINSAGNAADFGDLTVDRFSIAACSNGTSNRGLFGGGYNWTDDIAVIDYVSIDSPSNATDFGDLSVTRGSLAACSNGTSNRGLFGGGYVETAPHQDETDIDVIDYVSIDSPSNATDFGDLSVARGFLSATDNSGGEIVDVAEITTMCQADITNIGSVGYTLINLIQKAGGGTFG